MQSRLARASRSLVAATLSTAIAASSHISAGGNVPSASALALTGVFSLLVCVALVGRNLSKLRMSLAVAASQFAFHALFSTLGAPSGGAAGSDGHGHAAASILFTGEAASSPSTMMWLAHALAAVATLVVLYRGEAAFWGMRDAAVRFFTVIAAATPSILAEAPRLAPVDRSSASTVFVFLKGSLHHRGPPVAL